ncbi:MULTISPECIES: ComEC/Rec2 family competence protein [Caloramator]|uniref:DNA internalization-related competence protein ComEC/Rec2 n=1 Tax=Caloramator australicus RC3 TaxID=857293 RepID=I7K8N2_9CLOT|nr:MULTISPECIES: ComEC/Rec2 family competence protein [Caloramator]MDO6355177.1 ComEC/Rec2 family competence protein [Caloramator sp. CAR-1]CCJ33880.1 DNA internalization-related competence protein ComEC/Rec2 [Caloramator australicus RC3]
MKKFIWFVLLILSLFLINACSIQSPDISTFNGKLVFFTVDVGQGDCLLIKTPGDNYVMIDSGSQNEENKLKYFLNEYNIRRIDYVVATHPHEDHIGNMDYIIKNFDVKKVYMPKVTSNTKSFENLMEAIEERGLKINTAKAGVNFQLDGVEFKFLAPNRNYYEDLNNYSAVLMISYDQNKILLMGDAEKPSEDEIIKKFDVKADILKVGHHGSSSSTGSRFLNKVNPSYAVISCGKNNDYGHPHRETLSLLKKNNINILRTDLDGTIIFLLDGQKIELYR